MNWWQILIIILSISIFIYIATSLIIVFLANTKIFLTRGKDPNNNCYLKYEDFSTLDRKEYQTKHKDAVIRGFIYSFKNYNKEYKGFIILSHGMWGSHIQYLSDIEYLTSFGYLLLAYDNYGVSLSDGNNQVSLANSIFVLDTIISDVENRNLNEGLDILLYGHSMGGYAISCNLKKHHEIKKAIIRSSPITPSISGRDLLVMNKKTLGYILYPSINFCFILLFGRKNNQNAIKALKKNKNTSILLIHAKNDNIVPFKHSVARYFLNHKQNNIKVYVSESGKHNSIMEESSLENYNRLKNEYYTLVKKNNLSKLDEFNRKLEKNKKEYYHKDDDTLTIIKYFLID